MTPNGHAGRFLADVSQSLAPGTIAWLSHFVGRFDRWQRESGAGFDDPMLLRRWVDYLQSDGRIKASTVRSGLTSARRYVRWLAEDGGVPVVPQARAKPPKPQEPLRWTPSDVETGTILATAPGGMPPPAGIVATVLLCTGMRDGEACSLGMRDWRVVSGRVVFSVLTTKTRQPREAVLREVGNGAFRTYIQSVRPVLVSGCESASLFPSRNNPARHVDRDYIEEHIRVYRKMIGMSYLTAHALRRGFVTWAMRKPPGGPGLGEQEVMKLIGHTNPANFRKYYRPSAEDLVGLVREP